MTSLHSLSAVLGSLPEGSAVCAFNIESYDGMEAVMHEAADAGQPVVLGVSIPVAERFGYTTLPRLVALIAESTGTPVALHLDHAETPDTVRRALDSGFSSANFLNEGDSSPAEYQDACALLRSEYPDADLEFIHGHLGHVDGSSHEGAHRTHHHDEVASDSDSLVAEVVAFARATAPTVLGFDMGSLHGMTDSTRSIHIDRIRDVAHATSLPLVLHGSSGVRLDELRVAVDAGIRKVNVESALRAAYMDAIRTHSTPGAAGARKPRILNELAAQALRGVVRRYLDICTVP